MKILVYAFAVLMVLCLAVSIDLHEKAHQQIYKNWGINSTIYYNLPMDIYTHSNKPCDDSNCELAHSINEAVGYNLMPIYLILSIGLFFIIIEIALLSENKK